MIRRAFLRLLAAVPLAAVLPKSFDWYRHRFVGVDYGAQAAYTVQVWCRPPDNRAVIAWTRQLSIDDMVLISRVEPVTIGPLSLCDAVRIDRVEVRS